MSKTGSSPQLMRGPLGGQRSKHASEPGLEVAALSLNNWSGPKVATIALSWIILVAVFSLWRQFSSSSISRLRGSDSHGFVIISEQPSPVPIAVAALLPPLILVGAWGATRKRRD